TVTVPLSRSCELTRAATIGPNQPSIPGDAHALMLDSAFGSSCFLTVPGTRTVVFDGSATETIVYEPAGSAGTSALTVAQPPVTRTVPSSARLPSPSSRDSASWALSGRPSQVTSSPDSVSDSVPPARTVPGRPLACNACRAKSGDSAWLFFRYW